MKLDFIKMHGCGNDYIYFDCLENPAPAFDVSQLLHLCDRHKGIGSDGIVFILPSASSHCRMRMYNADGSEAEMCGNAIRCVAKYLFEKGAAPANNMKIETLSGIKLLNVHVKNGIVYSITVNMGAACLTPKDIPVNLPGDKIVSHAVSIDGKEYSITCVSMGNPHCIIFCDDIDSLDLHSIGPAFENNPIFPQRTNTEFIQLLGKNHLKMRVWERGSGETMACGTGACAAAVAAVLNGYCDAGEDITVCLKGGDLVINCSNDAVYMTGDCIKVFEGVAEV